MKYLKGNENVASTSFLSNRGLNSLGMIAATLYVKIPGGVNVGGREELTLTGVNVDEKEEMTLTSRERNPISSFASLNAVLTSSLSMDSKCPPGMPPFRVRVVGV